MKSSACPFCGATIEKLVGTHHYKACGLPNVTLEGVVIRRCTGCEEGGGVEIPDLGGLHTLLADHLIHQKVRLSNFEIRFLRKTLGWSSKDFAEKMGVTPETVSRWEAGALNMAESQDRLLRLYVAEDKPIENYSIHDTEGLEPRSQPPALVKMQRHKDHWSPPVAPGMVAACC